ncbi:MAG: universal stress protein [Bacteroidia bacterium]|nr:universal stress protein [Bacteroidia bacterium]
MDTSKLKGRPPFPFETIAVAIAFSPRLEALLSESHHLAKTFGARLILIHVGTANASKADKIQKVCAKAGITNPEVIWKEGTPATTILQVCKENTVDLLVIGALKKESLLRFYIGSLARTICRKAKCSVLLLTRPSSIRRKPERIVVNGVEHPKTTESLKTAVYFAEKYDVKEVKVVKELDMTGMAMTLADDTTASHANKMKKEITSEAEGYLESIIHQCQTRQVQLTEKTVKGKPGFAIGKYARDKKADLLVLNSPDKSLGLLDRIFTHDLEFILEDLPCDILLVHSRNHSEK